MRTSKSAAALSMLSTLSLLGCGGGPIQDHARGVVITASVLSVAGDVITSARASELDACETEECLDAGEARWTPAIVAHGAAVDALASWQEALELALRVNAGGDPVVLAALLDVARVAVRGYSRLRERLAPFNLNLPELELAWIPL